MTRRLPVVLALLVLAAPALATDVAAQRPTFPSSYLRADISTSTGFVEVPRDGTRTIGWTLQDRSGDNEGGQGFPHRYVTSAEITTPGTVGWSVAAYPASGLVTSGESVQGQLEIRADHVIRERTITVMLHVRLSGQDARETEASTPVQVRIAPYHDAQIDVGTALNRLEPQEARLLQLEIRNRAPYPDTFEVELQAPPGWSVNTADQVSLLGQETGRIDASVIAPQDDNRFYYESSGLVRIRVFSANDAQATTLDATATMVRVEGVYLPPYTLPFFPLVAVLVGAFLHRRRKMFRRSRKEKGPPRDPELPPKKQALLEELKDRNPEAYERYQEKLRREKERREELYPEHKEAQLENLLDEDGPGEGS